MALTARQAAEDKKAEEIVVIDIHKASSLTHYFLITHGNSTPHVRAIADNLIHILKEHKVKLWHVEGMADGQWVLLDFGPVIAHVFQKEIRDFYNLERLWGDAPKL